MDAAGHRLQGRESGGRAQHAGQQGVRSSRAQQRWCGVGRCMLRCSDGEAMCRGEGLVVGWQGEQQQVPYDAAAGCVFVTYGTRTCSQTGPPTANGSVLLLLLLVVGALVSCCCCCCHDRCHPPLGMQVHDAVHGLLSWPTQDWAGFPESWDGLLCLACYSRPLLCNRGRLGSHIIPAEHIKTEECIISGPPVAPVKIAAWV